MRQLLATVSVVLLAACSHSAASQPEVWVAVARPGQPPVAAVGAASAPYTQGGPTATVSVTGSPIVGGVMIRAWRENGGARVQVYAAASPVADSTSPAREIGSYHLAMGEKKPITELAELGIEPLTLVCEANNPVSR